MNFNYEMIQEALTERGINIKESYIERAVKELGFEKFPEVGLSDIGLTKLVKTATDIYHSDVDLIPRKKEKNYSKSPIVGEIVKGLGKIVIDSVGLTFQIPRAISVYCDGDEAEGTWIGISCLAHFLGGEFAIFAAYRELFKNPKLGWIVLGTQIFTNVASGIYEHVRNVKNKSKEKIEEQEKCFAENDCRKCPNLNCPHLTIKKSEEIETPQRKSSIKNPVCF